MYVSLVSFRGLDGEAKERCVSYRPRLRMGMEHASREPLASGLASDNMHDCPSRGLGASAGARSPRVCPLRVTEPPLLAETEAHVAGTGASAAQPREACI